MRSYKIGIVGLWHLGEVYAASLAHLGHCVIGFDTDPTVLDFEKIVSGMKKPAVLFDTKNFLAEKAPELKSLGFQYVGIGR